MAGLGIPLEKGDKAFIFRYNPNRIFIVQEVEIIDHFYTGDDNTPYYKVRSESELIGTVDDDDRQPSGKTFDVPEGIVKSETYVKNVLKKYGRQLIDDIFERMT